MATKRSLDVTKAALTNSPSVNPGSMTLDDLPMELLLLIATLMTDDTVNTPVLSGDTSYTSSEGITKSYWSFDSHAFGNSGVLEAAEYDQVVKDSKRDICSFALTNKRMFAACENAMFRTIVECAQPFSFCRLLDIFVKKPELQRCVEHLSVRNTGPGLDARTNSAACMHRILDTDLLSCSLRSVDLRKLSMTTDLDSNVLKQWCLLLPKLRCLERLSMRDCRFFIEEFPYLPNVREAYFIRCLFTSIPDDPNGSITGAVFSKLPSLRILANNKTFSICPENMLQPFESTLECLSWNCWGGGENSSTFVTALCRLKNLKHIQASNFEYLFLGDGYDERLLGQDPCDLARTLETVEFSYCPWVVLDPAHSLSAQTRELERTLRSVEELCHLVFKGVRVVDFRHIFDQNERSPRPKGYGPDLSEWWEAETSADLSREELQKRSGIIFIYK